MKHDDAGVLRQQATLKQGALHGPLTLYDETGAIALHEDYDQGKREGERRIFVGGRLHTLARYRNGLQHGQTLLHHTNGLPAARLQYVDGLLHGEGVYFNEDGNEARRLTYAKGKLNGEARTLYPDGKLLASEPYVNDLRHGEAKWYSPDGTVTKRTLYADGKPVEPSDAAPKPPPARTGPPPLPKRR